MKAAILIFITLCLISGQVLCFSVFGCRRGSVMFKCTYKNERNTDDPHKEKYFCRDKSCKMGISTDVQSRWVHKGRFALYDEENSRFFTVFIRNLTIEDDGEYTCGNKQTWSLDVELKVTRKEPRCGKSVIRERYLGQKTFTFHCEYDEKFKTHTKVFYRLNEDPVHVLNSSQSSSRSSEEKFILSDSHKDHFNVTIRDISAADGGVYLCGVERDRPSGTSVTHTTFIKEIQLNVHGKITSVQVQAYYSKSVFINCTFPQTFGRNKKFFQKDSQKKIFVDKQNQWSRRDKVQMYDDPSEGRLKVFISDLTADDEATYRCGVNSNDDEDLFSEIKLTVNQADHFPASSMSAILGESVKLACNFPENHDETFKHICKENQQKICESISSSEKKRFEFSASRAGVFTVSISNVSVRDAGVYWCGAQTRDKHLTSVSLTNQHQVTLTMPPVVGREGDSSEIKCPYDEIHSKEIKRLCKGKCFTSGAKTIIQSDETHLNKPKISVKDETELNIFTVTLSDLRAEDAGIYWCTVKDAFNLRIELMIVLKDALPSREASVGGSVSISCKKLRSHTHSFFCRGDQPDVCVRDGVRASSNRRTHNRFSLTDETSAGVFTVNISSLTEEDSGKYWCAVETSGSLVFTEVHLNVTKESTTPRDEGKSDSSVIVAVSVGLTLLAVCLVLMLLKIKYSCKHGIISSSDKRETGDHEMVQGSDPSSTPLYSSIQLPTIPSDSQNPLYSTVQLPTIPSDSQNPLYSTVQLPTIPSDSQNPLYSTVQLPTIPSDSQNPLYSTVQLPTIPSDSQNPLYSTAQLPTIPSDGVLYASVSFQNHEESLSDSKVVFRKNEIHSDYASVKHSDTPNDYYH